MSEPPVTPVRAERPAPRRPSAARTLISVAIVIAAAAGLAAILTFCAAGGAGPHGGKGGPKGAPGGGGGRPPTTVGVARATVGAIPIEVDALGTVTPVATVNVNARVAGMLERVAFIEGQQVRKGQLLAQIDPRPFEVVVRQAQGQLLRDQALLRNARVDLARYRTLAAQDSIAGQQVDTQAALVQQDVATVSADQAAVGAAQLNLSFTRITAPVSGRAGLRQIDAGNQITANEATPITVVTQLDPISVVFSLPESAIAAVARGGGKGLAVTALDRAGGSVLAEGSLSTLDNVIDTTTGTVKAKARFGNPGAALFPNQFVNVVLRLATLEGQVVVPITAVRHGPTGDYVWVLQPGKTVKARPVTVGPGTAENVSIVSGLRSGETVITDGGDRLRDGGKVVLPGDAPRGPGGAGAAGLGGHGGHHRHGAHGPDGPPPATP